MKGNGQCSPSNLRPIGSGPGRTQAALHHIICSVELLDLDIADKRQKESRTGPTEGSGEPSIDPPRFTEYITQVVSYMPRS